MFPGEPPPPLQLPTPNLGGVGRTVGEKYSRAWSQGAAGNGVHGGQPETGPASVLDKAAGGLLEPALELPGGHLSQALGRCGLAPRSRLGPSYNQVIPPGTLPRSLSPLNLNDHSWHLLCTYCVPNPFQAITLSALTPACKVLVMHRQETEAQNQEDKFPSPQARARIPSSCCGTGVVWGGKVTQTQPECGGRSSGCCFAFL